MSAAVAYAALAGFEVISGLQQAELIRNQARLTQAMGEMNAKFAELDAYEAEKFGYTQSAEYQKEIDATISQQRAAYMDQGIDVNFGTAAEVQQETRLTGFLNKLALQRQARARAMGIKTQASNLRLGATMTGAQADINSRAAVAQGVIGGAKAGISAYERF